MNIKLIFRALKHRNYRLFFIGQVVSLTGTWMQMVAMSWLVYRLTNSPLLLGLVGFLGQIPSFFLTPFAGVVADRYNRRKILLITQFSAMLQALVLSFLVMTNSVQVWQIILLSMVLGFVNSFDIPVRQAFTIEMIDNKEDLGNAIALNSSMVNIARLIGPSVAGIIVATLGEGPCFILNALSYVAVIISLFMMQIVRERHRQEHQHVLHELKEGFVYAFNFIPIKHILILLSIVSLTGVPYQVLMPIFAKDIFHGGAQTLGFLMSMAGFGALMGAIYLAARKSVIGLGRIIALAALCFGIGVSVFSFSRNLWLSLLLIFIAGFSMMVQMAASNTVLQTIVEEDKRGRIMSFYSMSFIGITPFGSLLAGILANKIGAPLTLLAGGVCCIVAAMVFFRKLPLIRKHVHPIYVKKGIIPDEVVKGIGAASGFGVIPEK